MSSGGITLRVFDGVRASSPSQRGPLCRVLARDAHHGLRLQLVVEGAVHAVRPPRSAVPTRKSLQRAVAACSELILSN